LIVPGVRFHLAVWKKADFEAFEIMWNNLEDPKSSY